MQAPGLPPLPDIYQLLRTNSPIPAGVGVSYRETLSASACELSKCDDEVARLTLQLYSAQEKQRVAQVHHDAFASLASPIRRLPQEVLLEIFTTYSRCSDMPPTNNGRNVKDIIPKPRYKPPLHILSEVCAHWHRIILHAPGLWAYNTIGGDLPGHFVRRALELSGTLVPLHIQVTHYRPELLAILCKYRERLRSLRVTHLHSPRARREIDSALHGRLPLLRYLRLAVGPSPLGTAQLSESTLDFVASAPQLRSLSVTGSLLRLVPRQILLQLDHLTCSVDSQDDHDVHASQAFMEALPPTVHYHLLHYTPPVPRTRNNRIRSMSRSITSQITELSIGFGEYTARLEVHGYLRGIFTAVTLPILRNLVFHKAKESPSISTCYARSGAPLSLPVPWLSDDFLAFALRSSFSEHLTGLDLIDVYISAGDLLTCLKTLPALEMLSLADNEGVVDIRSEPACPTITNALLAGLCIPHATHSPVIVPLLRTLCIHSLLTFDDDALLSFLTSRRSERAGGDQSPAINQLAECHIRVLPGHWRPVSEVLRTQVAALRLGSTSDSGRRFIFSWTGLPRNIPPEPRKDTPSETTPAQSTSTRLGVPVWHNFYDDPDSIYM